MLFTKWKVIAASLVVLAVLALLAHDIAQWNRANRAEQRLAEAAKAKQEQALAAAGAVVAKDVPAPPVPSQVRNQVEAVQRAVPEAKPDRTEDVRTVWIDAQGPVLPCDQSPPHAAAGPPGASVRKQEGSAEQLRADRSGGDTNPGGTSGGALLRPGDRFRIRLVSVDLTTPQGATGTVGEAELVRFDGASLGRGPLDQDSSTVWRRQSAQERPRWFAMPMAGVTSRARAWAGVAIGRGRWGGVLGAAWKPGNAEYFGGVAVRW